MSSLMGILDSPDAKDKLINMLSSVTNEKETEAPPPPPPAPVSSPSFDMFSKSGMDAMLKMRNMMERLNRKDDYRIGLLDSIRPFLKNGRDRNIDAAIKFIQIMNFAKGR